MAEQWQNQIYQNYISGKMSAQGRSNYEADLAAGIIQAPEGAQGIQVPTVDVGADVEQIQPQPATIQTEGVFPAHIEETKPVTVPDDVLKRFWDGQMSDEGMKNLIADFRSGRVVTAESEDVSFLEGVKEGITGAGRRVPETEALPSWVRMPEMNNLSLKGAKSLIGTMAAGPDEISQVLKKQNPDMLVSKDSKGNYVFTSGMDGKKYAIKPGFRADEDLLRSATTMLLFAAGSRGGAGRRMTGAAGTQFGIEATQEMAGGKFDAMEIPLAALFEGGGVIAGKGAAAIKGFFKGKSAPEPIRRALSKVGVKTKGPVPIKTELEKAVGAAEKLGVTPLTSDVFPPKTFTGKTGQVVTERIPIAGTGPVRVEQQAKRIEAIRSVLNDFGATETAQASDDVMKDLLKKRGADFTKYTKQKVDVIEELSKDIEVDGVLSKNTVPINKTTAAIDTEVSRLKALDNRDVDPLIDALENSKTSFTEKSLSQVEDNRKLLGETLEDVGFAKVKSQAGKVKNKIYGAVNEDMGDFIKATGKRRDFEKWKVANRRIAGSIQDLKISALKSVIKNGKSTPEEVKKLLFSNRPSDVKRLYRSLSPEGKSRAKVAVWQEAAEKATTKDGFSTARFATALKNMEKTTGVFFRGKDKEVLDGLAKTLEITRRAEVSGIAPPTGVQNFQIIAALGLGSVAGGPKGAGIALSIGAAARVYESKAVRNLLIKIAKGQGNEQKHISKLVNILRTKHQLQRKDSAADKRKALGLINRDL